MRRGRAQLSSAERPVAHLLRVGVERAERVGGVGRVDEESEQQQAVREELPHQAAATRSEPSQQRAGASAGRP
eukprot:4373124-Prymnesium_polylepis.1